MGLYRTVFGDTKLYSENVTIEKILSVSNTYINIDDNHIDTLLKRFFRTLQDPFRDYEIFDEIFSIEITEKKILYFLGKQLADNEEIFYSCERVHRYYFFSNLGIYIVYLSGIFHQNFEINFLPKKGIKTFSAANKQFFSILPLAIDLEIKIDGNSLIKLIGNQPNEPIKFKIPRKDIDSFFDFLKTFKFKYV